MNLPTPSRERREQAVGGTVLGASVALGMAAVALVVGPWVVGLAAILKWALGV